MSKRRYQNRQACAPAWFKAPLTFSLDDDETKQSEETSGLKSILKKRPDQEQEPVVVKKQKRKVQLEGHEDIKKLKEEEPEKNSLFITVGTYDCSLAGYIHNPSARKLQTLFAMKPHTGYVTDLTLTDKWLLSGSTDETIAVFNSKKLREVGTCGSEGSVTKMLFANSQNLLVATTSGVLEIIRSSDWMTIWKEHAHKKTINDIAIHPSGSLGISVGEDSFMKFWDFRKCKLVLQIKLSKPASLVAFAPTGSHYVYCTEKVITFNATDDGSELCSTTLSEEAKCIQFVSDDLILVGLEDGSLQLVKVSPTSIKTRWATDAHPSRVRSIALAENTAGKMAVVSVCSGGALVVCFVLFLFFLKKFMRKIFFKKNKITGLGLVSANLQANRGSTCQSRHSIYGCRRCVESIRKTFIP